MLFTTQCRKKLATADFSGDGFTCSKAQSPFYYAPSIFAVFRNLVPEMWFEKSGCRKVVLQTQIIFLVREKWLTRKTGGFIL